MFKFDKVSKFFNDDEKIAVQDISFQVDDGEFVFLTGQSGSGKTTLLRLLLREYKPTEGDIFFNDYNLRKISRRKVSKLRRQIGVVFQDYQLLDDLNVYENIALPLIIAKQSRKEIRSRIGELLKLLGLTGYEKAFPSELSGGEAQRISLARALATAPKVIYADEPTGNLDHQNAFDIINLLKSVNQYGTTVIVATHNLEFVRQFPESRQLVLEKGRLIKDSKAPTMKKIDLSEVDSKTEVKTKEKKEAEQKDGKLEKKQSQTVDDKKKSTKIKENKPETKKEVV